MASVEITMLQTGTNTTENSGTDNNKLIAVNDIIATNTNSKISIDVLKNDSYIEPVTLTIVSRPAHADSWVAYNNTISYRPRTNNFDKDSLTYKITDVNGNASKASVEITMLQTSTNRLVCEDAAGQLQTTKDGVKWYPGHYLRKNAEEKSLYAEDILFLENPYTQGLILMVKWKNLEKAKNQYDFSVIDKYIKWIEPYGKRIAMRIMDRCFHGCTDADAPAYLRTDSRYHGGVEPMREGSIIRLWDPAVTDRVIALYQALGAKYNGNPTVAAITIGSGESAMAIDREKAAGYSPEAYERELVRKAVEVKKAFPNTIVLTGMNFIRGGEPRLTRIAEELAKIGGSGVITPRAYPHSQYYVYDTFRKMKGKIAIFPQVETGGLLPEETEELIYRFAVNDLGANFLSWNAAFYNSQDKRPNYLTNYVLPVVTKYKGATKTACPTSFAKCVTQCP